MPPPGAPFVEPPIAWLVWQEKDGSGCLADPFPSNTAADYEVMDEVGAACKRNDSGFIWSGKRPRQVRLRWTDDKDNPQEGQVPVMDEFGRLAATPLTELDFDEVWWALANFPSMSEDDSGGEDEDPAGQNPADGKGASSGGGNGSLRYPIRQMMVLVEQIADRQTEVSPADWPAWCARLEQTLSRAAASPLLDYFRSLKLNPLSPLRMPAFRPDFAEDANRPQGRLYEAMLDRVESQWKTASLARIGEEA